MCWHHIIYVLLSSSLPFPLRIIFLLFTGSSLSVFLLVCVCVPMNLIRVIYMSMGKGFFRVVGQFINGYITEENVSPLAINNCVGILRKGYGFLS